MDCKDMVMTLPLNKINGAFGKMSAAQLEDQLRGYDREKKCTQAHTQTHKHTHTYTHIKNTFKNILVSNIVG